MFAQKNDPNKATGASESTESSDSSQQDRLLLRPCDSALGTQRSERAGAKGDTALRSPALHTE